MTRINALIRVLHDQIPTNQIAAVVALLELGAKQLADEAVFNKAVEEYGRFCEETLRKF